MVAPRRHGTHRASETSVGDRNEPQLRQIVERIEIAAKPERVFAPLTEPTQLLAWWGDRSTFPSTYGEIDARTGGKWLSRWRGPDGASFALGGEILEIDPPRRLSLDVSNVTQARAALEEVGCPIIRDGEQGFYFEDPFGFVIDVVER